MKKLNPLSDIDCRNLRATPGAKTPPRLRDGGGLFLEALPSGKKVWRVEYRRHDGKRSIATLGEYGKGAGFVSLRDAREGRERVRDMLRRGLDPNQERKRQEQARAAAALATFAAAAAEWQEHKRAGWSESQCEKVAGILRREVLPFLGHRPVADITPVEVLDCLQRTERAGKLETAHKAREYVSAIFRRSVILGQRDHDPAAALKGALKKKNSRHMAHLTDPDDIAGLLRAIDGYSGGPAAASALRLLPLVFTRPGELRQARWGEFDLQERLWSIPAERMKARRPHLVPLCEQAVAILAELQPVTDRGPDSLAFPGIRDRSKPLSENTLNAGLRRLGYTTEQQTAHGFRHIASTLLHEMGWPSHVVEAQLAHEDRNQIRAVYNKAQYMPERVRMMQAWADYLDTLKRGERVIPIRAKGA